MATDVSEARAAFIISCFQTSIDKYWTTYTVQHRGKTAIFKAITFGLVKATSRLDRVSSDQLP
jgi:hypothetical protein